MGYYITAELEVKNVSEQEKEEIQQYIEENEDDFYLIFPNGASKDEGKWYDRNKHFNKLSSQYPNALFCLYCDGEDGAKWLEYYKDGKEQMVEAIITYEEIKEEKWV